MSLKVVSFESLGTVSYLFLTLTLTLTLTLGSRSLKMAPFDRPYASFYWSAIVNIALSCTIFELFDVE